MKFLMSYLFLLYTYITICSQPINFFTFYDKESLKFGLKDEYGIQKIPPQWDSLKKINPYFYLGQKSGNTYIYRYDETLNDLVRLNYLLSDPKIYSSNLVIVQQYGKEILKGVFDIHGREILPTFYSNIWISDNYILAELNRKISIYDLRGNRLISDKFNYIYIKNNYIYVKIEDKRFPSNERSVVYDPQLKSLTNSDWNVEGSFGKDGLLLIKTLTNEKFYINTQGIIIIKNNSQVNFESPFSNGFAIVSSQGTERKFGFINTKGKIVIPTVYDEVSPFQTNYAYFSKITEGDLIEGLINNKNQIKKIFPFKVISKSVYYDNNEATYYLSNHETFDADGIFKEDLHPVK